MALRVLMFTDLVGSTSLKTRLGDNAAGALIDEHRDLIRSLCAQTGGQIVDNAGDGFFLKFFEPSSALRFSLSLQREHEQRSHLPPVRVGIHLSEVREDSSRTPEGKVTDVHGLGVDVASRIQGLADGARILISQAAYEASRGAVVGDSAFEGTTFVNHGDYMLAGDHHPRPIWELVWKASLPHLPPAGGPKSVKVRTAAHSPENSEPGESADPWRGFDVVYRPLSTFGELAEDEIHAVPADGTLSPRKGFAEGILADGVANLQRGPSRTARIVVPFSSISPAFDTMLGAALMARTLRGERATAALKKLAKYASLVLQGLRPSGVPVEASIEAYHLAMMNAGGEALDQPAVGKQFTTAWGRLLSFLELQISDGKDPFKDDLLSRSDDFAFERAFIQADRSVYLKDLKAGEKWRVNLPGGTANAVALVLRQPRSILWKLWARNGVSTVAEESIELLVIDWGNGDWVFSTDPVQRVSLEGLYTALVRAEQVKFPKSNPWNPGNEFNHTLVRSTSATRLPSAEVLAVLRGWARADTGGMAT